MGRTKSVIVVAISVLLVIALRGGFRSLKPYAGREAIQPIRFDHKKHVVDNGLACSACHEHYERNAFAGLPKLETCKLCHEAQVSGSEEEKRLRKYIEEGIEIPWQRIYQMPGHVFFSHRRHVVRAKLDCLACHGDMAQQTRPPSRPLVEQTMDWCMACHQERKASVDCNACHR